MAEKKTGGRPPHEVETVEFKISTPKVIQEDLKRLVQSGYFGKSYNEAAEQLIRERLRQLLGESEFQAILRPEKTG